MPLNPYERYKQQSVMTMTQGEMLLKLFDEIIKQLHGAILYIGQKDMIKSNAALQKSQKITYYLKETLDFKYEISNNLAALYDFFVRQMIAANVRKNIKPIMEILPLIEELRDAFSQAARLARTQ